MKLFLLSPQEMNKNQHLSVKWICKWVERQQPKGQELLKEHLNGRHYYLPENNRRNVGYLEIWGIEGMGYNIQDWHFIIRYILHSVFLAYFTTKVWLFTTEDSAQDFSEDPVVKTPRFQYKRHYFNPWSGN